MTSVALMIAIASNPNLEPKPLNEVDGNSRNDLIAITKIDGGLRHHGPHGYGRDGSPKLVARAELNDEPFLT